MDAKEVCLRFLAAESEKEVQDIIESTLEMRDSSNWQPIDGRETNFNVTSNQASDGGKALTELMTNMVDAVLMKHAYLKNIDPKSDNAPKTMYEAVDSLIKNLRGGKLINLDKNDPWLQEFALKNLVIGTTGAKWQREGLPCYTFVDNGEGQRAEDFRDTFLSLSAGNKKSIPFVQGKYNMGSCGVLRYCGQSWFKLIISRHYDQRSDWAWTLVRRRPGNRESQPVAEYFIPNTTDIPSFDSDLLYPLRTTSDKPYDGVTLKTGTIVKLFDYQIGSKFRGFKGTRDILNENLVETILPFRLLDFRNRPQTQETLEAAQKRGKDRADGVDQRRFYGMEFLLLRSHKEEDDVTGEEDDVTSEDKISVGNIDDPDLGEVSISAIQLKRKIPGWLKKSKNRVFHTVNGQVQHKQTRGYLSWSGFPALKDRVVVIVDASKLTFSAHHEVWKGDREHISKTIVGEKYLAKVKTAIQESTSLKELQKKIAREELERASKVASDKLFQKLVDSDSNLAALLSERDPSIHMPTSGGNDAGSKTGGGEWDGGKYSPTFVRLEKRYAKGDLTIPINRTRPVAMRTDAKNNYLNRTDNPGRVIIDDDVRTKFGIRKQLLNGQLKLCFEPQESVLSVGDTFVFKIALKDEAMPEAVESEELTLRMIEKEAHKPPNSDKKKKGEHKSGESKNDKGKGENAPTLGLPKCILLTKDGREIDGYSIEEWPGADFNGYDGGVIADLGEKGVVYKVNYDNASHLKYRRQQSGNIAREVVTKKYILGMRILMLGYEHALRSLQAGNDDESSSIADFSDNFRRMAARGAASTVLALAENLPKIVDQSSVVEDVE